jgi:glyoxylase-like metal-dependent hydrolase (beta-lactamase superfamily II)
MRCVAVLLLLIPAGAHAQAEDSTAEITPDAASIVSRALDQLGGLERVRAIATLQIRGGGAEFRSAEVQGWSPERVSRAPHEEILVADFRGQRVAHEYRTGRHDGSTRWRRFIYARGDRGWVDFTSRTADWGSHPRADEDRRELFRRVPHYLLLEASENPAGLRRQADSLAAGRRVHVLLYAIPGRGEAVQLVIDADSGLLRGVTQRVDYLGLGDATAELSFRDYAPHETLGWFPAGHELRLNGVVAQRVRYTRVAVNDTGSNHLFEIPEEMRGFTAGPDAARAIAAGTYIYTSPQGFNALFLEFRDYVVAVEAPGRFGSLGEIPYDNSAGSSAVSEAFIERIHQTIPGKPIRYLAVTHFHSDHTGGARAFMAEGATILATPGLRGYFERFAKAESALLPDRLARTAGRSELRIESIAGRRVLSDGVRTVELINAGPTPHTEDALVVWLPAEQILFQGDLFYYDGETGFPAPDRLITMAAFGRWLERTGLSPQRIYGTHDRGVATMAHVRRAMREAEDAGVTSR